MSEHGTCTGCGIQLRGHFFDTAEGSFCCRTCSVGESCYCSRPVTPRGPYVPFSQTGLHRPADD